MWRARNALRFRCIQLNLMFPRSSDPFRMHFSGYVNVSRSVEALALTAGTPARTPRMTRRGARATKAIQKWNGKPALKAGLYEGFAVLGSS